VLPVQTGVLVSGKGTILTAILDAGVPVNCVIADRPCPALDLAVERGILTAIIDRKAAPDGFGQKFDRGAFTEAILTMLNAYGAELVVMAGFGSILSSHIHQRYGGKILNTHPSLLPAFPGWHPVEDALAAGATVTGCTVHLATEEVDTGPILAQEEVPILEGDTVETLHERIKEVERRIYPATILRVIDAMERGQTPADLAL
jgi:phosphoribosylglycinamide formyltransferase 1